MDLNLLLALDALLDERSVTRAAARMSIGQSAMSSSLGRLRKHFGDPLLVRDGQGLSLTAVAESLAPPVREAVRAARTVFEKPGEFDPLTDRRSFTIVAGDHTTLILLRPLISRLSGSASVNVMPVQASAAEQLAIGSIDMIILPVDTVPPGAGMAQHALYSDRFVLISDTDNVLGKNINVERFSQLPYIAYSGVPHPSLPDSQLETLGVPRQVAMTTHSFALMPCLVTGTQLIAVVPERLTRHSPVAVTEPPVPLRPLRESLIWHPRQTDDPAHRWLREQLIEQAVRQRD